MDFTELQLSAVIMPISMNIFSVNSHNVSVELLTSA